MNVFYSKVYTTAYNRCLLHKVGELIQGNPMTHLRYRNKGVQMRYILYAIERHPFLRVTNLVILLAGIFLEKKNN